MRHRTVRNVNAAAELSGVLNRHIATITALEVIMKTRRFISLTLIFIMLISAVPFSTPALASRQPSPWAVPEMNDANTAGFLIQEASMDFLRPLTRDEFCLLVVMMVERTLGRPLAVPATHPFVDDADPISIHAMKAWNYGIITGTTNTRFSPNSNVQRQQLCAMMIRAIKNLEEDMNRTFLNPGAQTLTYRDASRIGDFAVDAVKLALTNDIMEGNTAGYFLPRDDVTAQSCTAVIIRSFNRMEGIRTSSMSTAQRLDAAEDRLHIGYAFGDTEQGVTQDVTLPLTGSGGSTVTWTSSNNNIIGIGAASGGFSTGVVNVSSNVRNVTLTATIRIGNSTRTKNFYLTISPLSGDRHLLENAYNELEIYYVNAGDNADSVTGRIGLQYTVLGLPVTWHSSNSSVVNTAGEVNVPAGNEARTVTLTATFMSGNESRTKVFTLTVINSSFSPDISLHGIQLGMTQSQVTNALGTVRRTISASNSESWQIYHNTNNSNFIAVAFIGNRAAAVYSMASDVANQLRNKSGAVITVPQANAVTGVSAVSYTDPGNSSRQYAIMISDSASVIGSSRTLLDEGQEQLLFELVNAFRVRNSRSVLAWAPRLGTAARAHSSNRGSGNLQQRVTSTGFDTVRYDGGNIVSGPVDAFDTLRQIVNSSSGAGAMRTDILQSSLTLFGSGFSSGHSGSYSTYFTYALGSVTVITGVTARYLSDVVTTISVAVGASAQLPITLTIAPNNFNETFTITSSRTDRMTVHNANTTAVPATVDVRGVANGNADLLITGNCSGREYKIPVVVGSSAVTGLTIRHQSTSGNQLGTQSTSTSNSASGQGLYMAIGKSVTVAALTSPSGASNNVNWQIVSGNARLNSGNTTDAQTINNAATVNITARSNASAGQTSIVRASVAGASGVTYYVHFTVYFDTPLTLSPTSVASLAAGDATGVIVTRSGATNGTVTWTGNRLQFTELTNPAARTRIAATAGAAVTSATTATASARRNGFEGAITADFSVTQITAGLTITTHPASSTTVNMGENANLSVTATAPGNPTLTYQWFRNTTNTNTGGTAITGANGSSFSPPTSATGTFYYYVTVSRADNPNITATSNVATVIVSERAFTLTVSLVNLIPGQTTGIETIKVQSAIPVGHTVVWSMSSGSSITMTPIGPVGTNGCTISALHVTSPESGVLYATLMNGNTPVATQTVTINVDWPAVNYNAPPPSTVVGLLNTLVSSVVNPFTELDYGTLWTSTNAGVMISGNSYTASIPSSIVLTLHLTYNGSSVKQIGSYMVEVTAPTP